MKLLLDTNVIIDHLRKRQQVKNFLHKLLEEDAALFCCDIVVTEVIAGMRSSEEKETQDFLSGLEYVSTSYGASFLAGKIKFLLSQKGKTIATTDALIAAIAKSYGMTLVTNNTKDFQHILELKMLSITS